MALRLDVDPGQFDLDLGQGVTVTVRPMTAALEASARAAARRLMMGRQESDELPDDGLDVGNPADWDGLSGVEFVAAMAERAIVSWTGVLDMDDQPLPCERRFIRRLFESFPGLGERFAVQYLNRFEKYVTEGNGLPPSPSGSSAAGGGTVKAAESSNSPAPKGKRAKAGRGARTKSTRSSAKRSSPPGTSS